jgi:hypothetical protein
MPKRSAGRSDERRRQPRVSCRLHGRITHGRERIRARIVDISEGGLCLLLPVWLNPKQPLAIGIEVPGRETATVHVEIWHIRREKSRSSNSKVWVAGAILRDADTAYAQLLAAAGLATNAADRASEAAKPEAEPTSAANPVGSPAARACPPIDSSAASARSTTSASTTTTTASKAAQTSATGPRSTPAAMAADAIDEVEPRIFRVRCKAKGSPRTRVLSLAAESVEEAHKLATQDLSAEWDILEVSET